METLELMHYRKGKNYADRVVSLLTPHCEVIHIAGSIAREAAYCKDVEIVCIAKKDFIPTDLFGGGNYVVCEGFKEAVNIMAETITAGEFTGRYMKIMLKGNVKLDLFMPVKDDYFRMLTIRTGSKDFVKKYIAAGWTNKGWCGTANAGLRKMKDCYPKEFNGKTTWYCTNPTTAKKAPYWASEKEFFEWLGIKYLEPKYR